MLHLADGPTLRWPPETHTRCTNTHSGTSGSEQEEQQQRVFNLGTITGRDL